MSTSIAMGNFDGVHIAHRQIIRSAVDCERTLVPTAVLFRVHPCEYLKSNHCFIMSNSAREDMLRTLGIKRFYYMDFETVRDMSPEDFFEKIVTEELGAKKVSCGFNYTFGKFASGTTEVLKKLCDKNGVDLCITESVELFGAPVSSTRIRKLIAQGDVLRANKMLGHPFSYSGVVVDGKHMGRKLGFPTANQYFDDGMVTPRFGVYASDVSVDGKVYKGATNIGTSPTLPFKGFRSETYIHDFDGDLYGKSITVSLKEFIRDEMKFSSVEELIQRVNKDKLITKGI